MPEAGPTVAKPPVAKSSRRGWWLVLLLGWTAVVAGVVWWLAHNNGRAEDRLIRIGPGEAKSWAVRLQETAALARANSPWALAWILLAPYALGIGARYSFDTDKWRRRTAILLVAGAGFVAGSQWLSKYLSGGGTMIVMVNYTADATIEKHPFPAQPAEVPLPPEGRRMVTNRSATNRVTKMVISSSAAHTPTAPTWETTATGILASLPTNLPPLLAEKLAELPRPLPPRIGRWSPALDGFAYIALIGLAHAGVFHRRYREREKQATLLAARLNEARLHALQAQLQPHFLFNTLNGIATLLRRDPARAEDMLLSLSELLRIALDSSQRQEISLREEMEFLGRYLAIQKMRFGDRLEVIEQVQPEAMDCLVPALLLQPLVENAIRHGLEPSGQPGQLRITGSRDGDWLKLSVEDNGVGLRGSDAPVAGPRPPDAPDATRRRGHPFTEGVGLANVRERLATLHGTACELELTARPQGGVAVNIRLPVRTEIPRTENENVQPSQ